MNLEPLMTTADVAELLNCSERTVNRWRSEGLIPYRPMPGGMIRFDREEVLRVYRGEVGSEKAPAAPGEIG